MQTYQKKRTYTSLQPIFHTEAQHSNTEKLDTLPQAPIIDVIPVQDSGLALTLRQDVVRRPRPLVRCLRTNARRRQTIIRRQRTKPMPNQRLSS